MTDGLTFNAKVPKMVFRVQNEGETVVAMAQRIEAEVKARLSAGLGATGSLATPKAGGRPLIRTGALLGSIGIKVERRGDRIVAIVRPLGERPANEKAAQKAKRARKKTKQLRAAAVVGFTFASLGGGHIPRTFMRTRPTKSGQIFKTGAIRVRTADTNAALAGILSVPPKDKRARAGGRAAYRVLASSELYKQLAAEVARRVMRAELVAEGRTT